MTAWISKPFRPKRLISAGLCSLTVFLMVMAGGETPPAGAQSARSPITSPWR